MTALARSMPGAPPALPWSTTIAAVAALGLAFQVGHFFEHFLQFAIWVLGTASEICGRDTPWMSPWAVDLVRFIGNFFFPADNAARQMMLGMEVLHLIGNSIFLVALAALYYCVRNKWVRWGFYIELFHLYEHIMLTTSAIYVGKPIGMSTLFGAVGGFEKEAAVGIRVTWHFLMNLLPMPFAMIGMMEHMKQRQPPAVRTRARARS